MPEPGRPDQALCAAQAGRNYWCAFDDRLAHGAGAIDVGDCGASSAGKIFRGVVWPGYGTGSEVPRGTLVRQEMRRLGVRTNPLRIPNFSTASIEYTEQVGW